MALEVLNHYTIHQNAVERHLLFCLFHIIRITCITDITDITSITCLCLLSIGNKRFVTPCQSDFSAVDGIAV